MFFSLDNGLTGFSWWPNFLFILFFLFVGASLLQIIGYWTIFARFALRKETKPPALSDYPPLSVVICARNEADNLRKNLPALLTQQYPNYEVLIVDDDSTDESRLVLQNFQRLYPHLRILVRLGKQRAGKKDALADGIKAAKHELLVLTDADCMPAGSLWLSKTADAFLEGNHTEIVLGYGPYRQAPGLLNKWIRFETVNTALQYFSFTLAGMPYMGVGRNVAWKKPLFDAVGGFESHAHIPSGDDDLFINAAAKPNNTTILLDPDTFVYSEAKKTFGSYYRQKRRHLTTGKHYRPKHQFFLGLLALSHVAHYTLMLFLLFFTFGTVFVWSLYIIRIVSVLIIYRFTLLKLREPSLLPFVPIFDAAFVLFYLVFAPIVILFNNKEHPWT